MKVIQSFWSKPIIDELNRSSSSDNIFCDNIKYKPIWLSWILNNYLLNLKYDITLFTDSVGANFLVDILGLKFKNIVREFDNFDYPSYLWALGKIRALSLQSSPFIHIDNDVFLFDGIPENLLDKDVFIQSMEPIEEFYPVDYFESLSPKLSDEWIEYRQSGIDIAMNTGVIGGKRASFFKYYSFMVFDLIKNNMDIFRNNNSYGFMLLLEQYMLAACSRKHNIDVFELLKCDCNQKPWEECLVDIDNQANSIGYVHLWAKSKNDIKNIEAVEKLISHYSPKSYENFNSISNKHLEDFFVRNPRDLLDSRHSENNIYVLSDIFTGTELYSGIWNFTQSWVKFSPQMKVLESMPDINSWNMASIVVIEFFMTWERKVAVEMESVLSQIPSHIKKVFIVHEINEHSYKCLLQADFIIYINKYQEFVGNHVMGLNKPFQTVGALPRNEFPATNEMKPFIYVGGHFVPNSNGDFSLYDRLSKLLYTYDDKNVHILLHPALRGHYMTREYTMREFYKIMTDKKCDERVVIYDEHCETYSDMKAIMSKCKWCYLWRDDILYEDLLKKYEAKDKSLIFNRIGDSGMLRDAWESGCELIVEPKARYATYFDKVKPITWRQFSSLIEDISDCL